MQAQSWPGDHDWLEREFRRDGYAGRLIAWKVRRLVRSRRLPAADCQDAEQDLAIRVLRSASKFNPERATWATFVSRVIDNGIATILKARSALKRGHGHRHLHLDEGIDDEEARGIPGWRKFDELAYIRMTSAIRRIEVERLDLHLDLETALGALTSREQVLGELLSRLRIAEVSRSTGTPRTTVYDEIERLRSKLEDAGLAVHAKKAPTVRRQSG